MSVQRGAHTFFLRAGKVQRWAGYTLNLIHYQDAARLVAAVRAGLSTLAHPLCPVVNPASAPTHPSK